MLREKRDYNVEREKRFQCQGRKEITLLREKRDYTVEREKKKWFEIKGGKKLMQD